MSSPHRCLTWFSLASVALAASLGACSFAGKLGLGSDSKPDVADVGSESVPGSDSVAAAKPLPPTDELDPETEQDVNYLVGILDSFQEALDGGGGGRSGALDVDLAGRLFFEPAENIQGYAGFEALGQRYLDAKLAFAKRAGPRAVEIMGDARPTTEIDEDAQEALDDALRACSELARISNSEKQVAVYQEKLARARKIDEATLRANGNAVRVASCELVLNARSMDFADDYVAEQGTHETERGCGQMEFSVRAVKTGRGWGSWEYAMGSTSYAEKVACKKLKKRAKLPKKAKAAVKEALDRIDAKGVAVWNGKYTTQVDDDDYHVYRYATLTFHSKNIPFSKNACGGKGDDLVCEASGSKSVGYYNRMVHWRKRAAVHKEAGRADRCKELLKKAVAEYEGFTSMYEGLKGRGGWAEGLRYKPRDAKKPMKEKAFLAAFDKAGKKADDDAIGGWCGDK